LYNGIVLGFGGVKKILIFVILAGVAIYFIGPDKLLGWLGRSQVLGEEAGPMMEERVLKPVQEAINQYIRWPRQDDLEPLPRLIVKKETQGTISDSNPVDFDQSLKTLTEDIQNLPQQQLIKVKEQLIKEVFPDCECSCSIVKDDNN